MMSGPTVAVSTAFVPNPKSCPTTADHILNDDPRTGKYAGGSSILDKKCGAQIRSLLEYKNGQFPHVDNTAYFFMLERLTDLHANCRSIDTRSFRRDAQSIASEGALFMPEFHGEPFGPMASADRDVDSRKFRIAFASFEKHNLTANFATRNPVATMKIIGGVKDGANGNFLSAETKFRQAFTHATDLYPLAGALYFLGVARLALNQQSTARATWCVGLRLVDFQGPSPRSDVNWNLLLANRLAHP